MRHLLFALPATIAVALLPFAGVQAQPGGAETFTATASLKTSGGAEVTAPVVIGVTRTTTEAERTAVAAALKAGGTAGVVKALAGMPDAGYIEVGQRRTTLKYAYVRPTSGGRIMTVIAPTPIVYLGAGLPNAAPKKGFDLSLAILEIKEGGAGTGELVPAATIRLNESGAVQTQDYGADVVRLTNVLLKK